MKWQDAEDLTLQNYKKFSPTKKRKTKEGSNRATSHTS